MMTMYMNPQNNQNKHKSVAQTLCLKSSTGQNFVVPLLENQELHKTLMHTQTQQMHIIVVFLGELYYI